MASRRSQPGKKSAAAATPAARRASAPAEPADKVAQIQRIIDVMAAAGAVEVLMEDAGSKIRVRLREERPPALAPAAPLPLPAASQLPAAAAAPPVAEPARPAEPDGELFLSPMVGTFYRASSPSTAPYVQVGDRFGPDSTLCIIEAMKVMNEIKAEIAGLVRAILVENGQPVEFGQPLFRVAKA
jgi:acetyl-CoA carboxylase biotin carboxyl carrier protein